MPWPFDRQYMQLALAAGLVVGACAPMIGAFLVPKRLSLMGDGIGHLAFAGIAAGVVMMGLAGSLNANIFTYLFGSILTVRPQDVWLVVVLGAGIVGALSVAGRALFAGVVDEEAARVAGVPVDWLNTLLAVLTAIVVVAAMRVVGVLLVAALMVLPVGASQQLARSFRGTLALAVGIGVACVILGLAAARLWGLAAGGAIVLVATATFAVASAAGAIRRRRTRGPRRLEVPTLP